MEFIVQPARYKIAGTDARQVSLVFHFYQLMVSEVDNKVGTTPCQCTKCYVSRNFTISRVPCLYQCRLKLSPDRIKGSGMTPFGANPQHMQDGSRRGKASLS